MSHPSVPDSLHERFDIHDAIEPGSTGPRFRATDKSNGRKGVLVLVDAAALPSSSDRQRVRRELAKQATLSHPNLALPLVTGEAGKNLYYLREDVPGTTLRTRLSSGTFQPSEALAITTQIAAGLDELHRAGLLFRDLKPERIVVQDGGNVVLLEAGLAAPIENEETVGLQGTAPYVSPEQAKGKLQSFRSDLYALGVILHEMIVGEPPHSGDDVEAILAAHRADEIPAAPSSLPEGAQELHQQLLAREPRKRPFSAQQVRQSLNPFLPSELQVAGGDASPKRAHKATMLGMPAVGPARPPSMQPARPPSMEPPEPKPEPTPERKAGTTGHGNPDRTQQVALADIIEEEPIAKKASTPPAAPGTPSKPPPHPGSVPPEKPSVETTQPLDALDIIDEADAPTTAPVVAAAAAPVDGGAAEPVAQPAQPQPVAEPAAQPAAQADAQGAYPAQPDAAGAAFPDDPIPAPEGADVDDGGLDYDDLAETIAREAPSELAGMSPAVGAGAFPPADASSSGGGAAFPPAASGAAASSAGAQPAPQQASGAAAASGQGAYAEPVQAEPAGGNKNGLFFLAGGALIFLSVALFIGWQIISSQDETGPMAMAPSAAPAATPATPATPTQNPATPATPAAAVEEPKPEEVAAEEATTEEGADEAAAEEAAAEEAAAAEAAAAEAAAAEAAAEEEEEEEEEPASTMTATRRTRRATARTEMAAAMAPSGGSAFDQTREQAREAFQARNWAVAAQLYQRATAMNPRHAGSWSGLGAAQMQMRNYNGAVQSYQRAVTLSPRSSGFFTALGHAYRAQGNRNAARQAYQRALALSPQNRSAQQALQAL